MGKRKSSSTSTTTERATVTPNNPLWVTDQVQGLGERLGQLGRLDPYSLVSPLSAGEQQASQGAAALGRYGVAYDESADWTRGVAAAEAPQMQAASLLEGIEAYYNPYRGQVIDAAAADFDAEAGRTRATQDLALAGQGAFGGSGAALTRSLTEGELARARNTQISGLLRDMFNTSAGLASQDAERRQQASAQNAQLAAQTATLRLQAANGLAGLAGARAASDREDVATQAALGAQVRGVDQAYRLAPYTALNSQADILSKLPLELFRGTTTEGTSTTKGTSTQTPSFLDNLAQAADIASTIYGMGKKAPSATSAGTP